MKKFFLPLVLIAALISVVIIPYQSHALSELEKINRDLARLKRQQDDAFRQSRYAKNRINAIHNNRQKASKDIVSIQKQVSATETKLAQLQRQIQDDQAELVKAGKQVEEARQRVASQQKLLDSRLRLMYTNGFVSYMDVLLSSTSFSDFLDRYDALRLIVSQNKELLQENQRNRDLIVQKKAEIAKKFAEVRSLYAQAAKVKRSLDIKQNDKEVLIASLNREEKEMEDITEEQEQMMLAFARKRSELLAKKSRLSGPKQRGGKFGYPLVGTYPVTSGFGYRNNPTSSYRKTQFHKGIDFGAPKGTSILAAESGTVIVAGWWSGYGNCVIIDHGKGVWTLYGHMSRISTSLGDTVSRGQKIGEVGSTGDSTGNHLHFEVRIDEKPVNPTSYLW